VVELTVFAGRLLDPLSEDGLYRDRLLVVSDPAEASAVSGRLSFRKMSLNYFEPFRRAEPISFSLQQLVVRL
jgi:hypothetical protein